MVLQAGAAAATAARNPEEINIDNPEEIELDDEEEMPEAGLDESPPDDIAQPDPGSSAAAAEPPQEEGGPSASAGAEDSVFADVDILSFRPGITTEGAGADSSGPGGGHAGMPAAIGHVLEEHHQQQQRQDASTDG